MNTDRRARLGWRFWLITLAALAAVVLTASLGRWQLSRAAQKLALQAALDERAAQPPLAMQSLAEVRDDRALQPLLHRQVQLRGQWVQGASVFLDNRQMYGRPGFFVFTPLRLALPAGAEPGAVVLVQRGWVLRDFLQRTRLPEVATPAGDVQLQGRVAGAPSRLYEFQPSAGTGPGSSRIRQNLDLAAFAAETGLPLLPLSVVQTGAGSGGLSRDWPAVDNGVDKHYGYAFQWFGLCALVAILYVWFQLVRRFARPRP
ncbi:SURF1 family protein [Pulveribacter suum]|uniref:SURF1-like protein n=1 Tax=Pulveribacter suum TaxID=2116657 RepID=A0A2P1NJ29_9BURK|nr:SURF1 family protein [Pulveribacter suum]AVP57037.1 transmembrane cytochrome oxidase [Pulveribacter suum]